MVTLPLDPHCLKSDIFYVKLRSCADVFFFFSSRRRHTRLQGDWSSDVCSSDLSSLWPMCVTSSVMSSSTHGEASSLTRVQRAVSPRSISRPTRIRPARAASLLRSEEHTSELQSPCNLVCRLLLEKKTVHQALARLERDVYIQPAAGTAITLTPSGPDHAEAIASRPQMFERVLIHSVTGPCDSVPE